MNQRRAQSGSWVQWTLGAVLLASPAWAQDRITVEDIRTNSLPGVTRIAIQLSGETEIKRDRLSKPERLFFDFNNSRTARQGLWTIPVGDEFVSQIRVGSAKPGVTRVVLDFKQTVAVEESVLLNPYRVILELRAGRGSGAAGTTETARETGGEPAPPAAQGATGRGAGNRAAAETRRQAGKPTPRHYAAPAALRPGLPALITLAPPTLRWRNAIPRPPQWLSAAVYPPLDGPPLSAETPPTPRTGSQPAAAERPRATRTETAAAAPDAGRVAGTGGVPTPTQSTAGPALGAANGGKSLTRALGLKVRRVVLDAGHGGHDQGSSGPSGLLEKELVLDVALRLGKLIEATMGSEVVYTRQDDRFIPLEERTRIANASRADLFLSIHANSSALRNVSGVETYYLSLSNSRAAMEIAARENASSDRSVFELRELLQKIATQDKIEESKEFAAKVNGSLYKVWGTPAAPARNRGVKKAPFIVLIGASMPSVLAEIGFLSNNRDEREMKKPEVRQRIAEALLKGISQYAETLSHFAYAGADSDRESGVGRSNRGDR